MTHLVQVTDEELKSLQDGKVSASLKPELKKHKVSSGDPPVPPCPGCPPPEPAP